MRAQRKQKSETETLKKLVAAEHASEHALHEVEANPRKNYYDELTTYMSQLKQFPTLTANEDFAFLFERYRNGSEKEKLRSRDLLVYGNIKLVLRAALGYTGRGLPLLDLMQEGVFGLLRAIEMYEIEKGFRFSTYAFNWIRQAMTRAIHNLNERDPYRTPVHYAESVGSVRIAFAELFLRHGRAPKTIELYQHLKSSGKKNAEKLTLADVAALEHTLLAGKQVVRLDHPITNSEGEEGGALIDSLNVGPPKTESVVEARRLYVEYTKALDRISAAVDTLPPRSAMIVRLRFGLGDFEAMTLEEIGERYEVTRERIRQIEAKALETLETKLGITSAEIAEIIDVIQDLEVIANAV